METGKLAYQSSSERTAMMDNWAGCCEGTVFTFTSAGSKWRLRQRLNRHRAPLLVPPELLFEEEQTDKVFSEMRMMLRSAEANPSDGGELCNSSKSMASSTTVEEPNNANITANRYCNGDVKKNRSGRRLTGQIRGDPRDDGVPLEAVKAERGRNNDLAIWKEAHMCQKSRRYIKCENFRESERYANGVPERTSSAWNERKLELYHALEQPSREASNNKGNKKPAEERRNKRESCAADIHVFEQRKVKCRRKEQFSCSSQQSVENEDLSQADDVKQATSGFNNRREAAEQLRHQTAVDMTALSTYVAREMSPTGRRRSLKTEDIEDKRFKYSPQRKSLSQFHDKRGHVTEGNRTYIPRRLEIKSASIVPLACSFISFKEGVPCRANRKYPFPREGSLRAKHFSDRRNGADTLYYTNKIQPQLLLHNRPFPESIETLAMSATRTGRNSELSLSSINVETEASDAETNTVGADSSHCSTFSYGAPHQPKSLNIPQELPCSRPLAGEVEMFLDRGGIVVTSSALRGLYKPNLEMSHRNISSQNSSPGPEVDDTLNFSQQYLGTRRERVKERLASRSLSDWYGSIELEEITDVDYRKSNDTKRDDKFSARCTDALSPVPAGEDFCDEIIEGLLDGSVNRQLSEVDFSDLSRVLNRCVDGEDADIRDKPPYEIAGNNGQNMLGIWESDNLSFRETKTRENQSTDRCSTSSRENRRTEAGQGNVSPQKSVPSRKQTWGFKRKTGEKVSYFESWLGRGKKDTLTKPHKKSQVRMRGVKGVGELSEAKPTAELKLDCSHDEESNSLDHSIDRHLKSQASSKIESRAYVKKEFEILEAVLQSEVTADEDEAQAVDYPPKPGFKSSPGLDIANEKEHRWQDQDKIPEIFGSQALDGLDVTSVAANLETEVNHGHVEYCVNRQDPLLERREPTDEENCQLLDEESDSSAHENLAKLASLGQHHSVLLTRLPNAVDNEAKESLQILEEGEDPTDAFNIVSQEFSLKPQDLREFTPKFDDFGVQISFEGSEDRDNRIMFPSSRNRALVTLDTPGFSEEDQFGSVLENVVERVKPHLAVIDNSRDISTYTLPDVDHGLALKSRAVADICRRSRLGCQESSSSHVMAGSKDDGTERTVEDCSPRDATAVFGDRLTAPDTPVNIECSPANLTSESESFDQLPPSIEAPLAVKEVFANEKIIKESTINRRHKTPIIVRVRNRLANGWPLQHYPWKKVAKQKLKAGDESQVCATKSGKPKQRHVTSSSWSCSHEPVVNSPTALHESRTEKVINTDYSCTQATELTRITLPLNLEAQVGPCDVSKSIPIHEHPLEDLHECEQHQWRTEDIRSKISASEMSEVEKKNQINQRQPPLESYDEVEQFQLKRDDSPGEVRAAISFSTWESQATGFRESFDYNKNFGGSSIADLDKKEMTVTDFENSSEFSDGRELLLGVVLGNRMLEATILGKFSDFDAGGRAPEVLRTCQLGGESLASGEVHCNEVIPAVCLSKREGIPVGCQMPSDCSVVAHIVEYNSKNKKSCYCQTESLPDTKIAEKKLACTATKSQPNLSFENNSNCIREGAEPELSQECDILQKYLSLTDQNEDLHTCSSTSLDHGFEGSPYVPGRIYMAGDAGGLIDEQTHFNDQRFSTYFIPQVENMLDYNSVELLMDESAPPSVFHRQPRPATVEEQQHESVPNYVQRLGQARVVPPFRPPLHATSFRGESNLVCGSNPLKEKGMEDMRRSSPQVRERYEAPPTSISTPANEPAGDLKYQELMEMLKMTNQQQPLPGYQPSYLPIIDTCEHVYRTGKQTNALENSYQRESVGAQETVCLNDAPTYQNSNELSTEEQVFLERYSATCNSLKSYKHAHNGFSVCSKVGFKSLRQSYGPSFPDFSTQSRPLSAPIEINCGRASSPSVVRSVEPYPLRPDLQLIDPLPACPSRRSSLGEARRPESSKGHQHDGYNTYEPKLLPDFAAPCDYPPPQSSNNGSLDCSPRLCIDCQNKCVPQLVQGADGVHEWKSSVTQGCIPSMAMHSSSFSAQCQCLILNTTPSSCRSHLSQLCTDCRCDSCNHSCTLPSPALISCHHPLSVAALEDHDQCHFCGHSHSIPVSPTEPCMCQKTRAPFLYGFNVQDAKKSTMHPYCSLQIIQPSARSRPWPCAHFQQPPLPRDQQQFADKKSVTHNSYNCGQARSNSMHETDQQKGLVWLSKNEQDLIQQLRLSDEKAIAGVRQQAAVSIQRSWRRYLEKKTLDLNLENGQQATALTDLIEYPIWQGHQKYCKLHQTAISSQICSPSSKEMGHGDLVNRSYRTMQRAASLIQHVWRSVLRRRKERILITREWPKNLKVSLIRFHLKCMFIA